MKQAIVVGLSALLLAVCIPMLLLTPGAEEPPQNMLLIIEDREVPGAKGTQNEPPSALDEAYDLRIKTETGVRTLRMGEYLTGVVLSEMPASFSLEALKAQAVAARTFTLRQMKSGKHDDCDLCGSSGCCQAWTDREVLEEKMGASLMQYWEKAAEAVSSTDGEVLTYGGQLIDAVYFSCSGGATEPAAAVWGSDFPYLQSVPSPGEEQAGKYESEVVVSIEEFRWILL